MGNILLILGCAALICALPCRKHLVYRDGSMMLVGSLLLLDVFVDRRHGLLQCLRSGFDVVKLCNHSAVLQHKPGIGQQHRKAR